MSDATSKGGQKNRKYGRNKIKCARYRTHKIREKNKIKRILKSNGVEFAKKWARENNVRIPGIQRVQQ